MPFYNHAQNSIYLYTTQSHEFLFEIVNRELNNKKNERFSIHLKSRNLTVFCILCLSVNVFFIWIIIMALNLPISELHPYISLESYWIQCNVRKWRHTSINAKKERRFTTRIQYFDWNDLCEYFNVYSFWTQSIHWRSFQQISLND